MIKWIQKALGVGRHRFGKGPYHRKSVRVGPKKRGVLHRQLGVSAGEKIPYALLLKHRHAGGKLGRRVRLALTLRKLRRR